MATNQYDFTPVTTHDLWVEARQFSIDISRPTSSSIKLVVSRPAGLKVTDGAVILLSASPISANNYPKDGTQYTGSLNWAAPADMIADAHVVATFSGILGNPFPANESTSTTEETFSITVTGTQANVVYYASVHACTNVLQFYPIGAQSYPLSDPDNAGGLSTYTGNIPSLPAAPTTPTPGMVYYDQQLNSIQYYDGVQQCWVSSRADTIAAGTYNPGTLGQAYLLNQSRLMVFNGTTWAQADSTNFQVRVGAGWSALGTVSSATLPPNAPAVGDMFYDYTTLRVQYWDGTAWIFPNSTNTLFNTGSSVVPSFVVPFQVEAAPINAPYVGELFYNSTTKALNVWDGSTWAKANTDQQGVPSFDKINIGSNGSLEARSQLSNILKSQLGWPQQCVELQQEQFNIAIDNALDNYRQLADGAYTTGYIVMPILADQQTYYLNSPVNKTDHVVSVNKAHRLNVLGAGLGSDNIYMQAFLTEYYYSNGSADILSTHLLAGLSEDLERIFAGNLTFVWNEATREITFTRKISRNEKVILEAQMERTEQELILDRWCKQFIQNWALAECKMMLGLIRSKFTSGTPGATGNINLNGELLMSEARSDMERLKQSILDYEYGGHVGHGNVSFLIG